MNVRRMMPVLLLCLMLAAPAAQAEERTAYVVVEAGSVLNVRMNPGLSADVLFVMERGETLTIDGMRRDGWVEVSRAGDFGYCRIEYLSDAEPADPEPYVTTAGKLHVRQLPGGDSVRKLKKGVQVMVTGWLTDENGTTWARVDDGYINVAYLTPADENGGA